MLNGNSSSFRFKCTSLIAVVMLVSLLILPFPDSIAGDKVAAKTWLSGDINVSLMPPDALATESELNALRDRVAAVSEADKSNVVKWTSTAPNHHWVQALLGKHIDIGPPSPKKGRAMALMNVAIYDAVVTAGNAKAQFSRKRPAIDMEGAIPKTSSYPSAHAAAATAASEVVSYLLPDTADYFQQMAADAHRARIDAGLNYPSDIAAGEMIGKAVAAKVIEFAKNDNSDLPFEGERPTGPGSLKGEIFVYPTAGDTKTVSIESVDPHLPGPPPQYDSPELAAEIAQLKAMERPLPKKMLAWTQHSTKTAYRWWYDNLAMSMFERGMQHNALETAHIYASFSAINHDALIACFKAKYMYWQIRPAQLDESVPTTFPSPPHPSYPSAHSCSSTSYGTVASHFFPEKKDLFMAAADSGGMSRLIAGIHYPSDDIAGDAIGLGVAEEGLSFVQSLTGDAN